MARFHQYIKCPYCARYMVTKVALELHLELDHECYPYAKKTISKIHNR
ncbi:MAG: hypothetical protein RMJ31_02965 [Nitrososphaerota archaeon]|nr:hypothetical protein [Nitrososphaerales archaeon]MDW8044718.1 hypothetical protein [Nitrososphaerota archaeon]